MGHYGTYCMNVSFPLAQHLTSILFCVPEMCTEHQVTNLVIVHLVLYNEHFLSFCLAQRVKSESGCRVLLHQLGVSINVGLVFFWKFEQRLLDWLLIKNS